MKKTPEQKREGQRIAARKWRAAHQEQHRTYMRTYMRTYWPAWKAAHQEQHRVYMLAYQRARRRRFFIDLHVSGQPCGCCIQASEGARA